MSEFHNRRSFLQLALAAGAAWAVADLSQVEEALAWAAQPHAPGAAARELTVLSALDARVVDAMTSRILPATDGRPGAHEAGVVYFIDRALATFNASQKRLYVDGIKELNERAVRTLKGATSFATLTTVQQDDVLREIEQTPFFQAARFDTVIGTFALPTYGGNHDYIGWQMIGLAHQSRFQPPFGYYDAEANRRS